MSVSAAWVALSLVRGIGGVTMQALLAQFGTPEAVIAASERDLRRVRGVGQKTAAAICAINIPRTTAQIARWQQAGVAIIHMDDDAYPARLRTIPDLPPTLFTLGSIATPNAPHIAIVGTRTPSDRAQMQAERAGHLLAKAGAVIISGMAAGIDGIAQTAALEVPDSHTVGVLGSGVLKPYPPENAVLAHMLQLYGGLVCEVAPDAIVNAPGLVARNRIITGMADAVLIVQTSADGGAMHAARAAYRQGRRLYAIDCAAPGNRVLLDEGHALPVAPDLSNLRDMLNGH